MVLDLMLVKTTGFYQQVWLIFAIHAWGTLFPSTSKKKKVYSQANNVCQPHYKTNIVQMHHIAAYFSAPCNWCIIRNLIERENFQVTLPLCHQ